MAGNALAHNLKTNLTTNQTIWAAMPIQFTYFFSISADKTNLDKLYTNILVTEQTLNYTDSTNTKDCMSSFITENLHKVLCLAFYKAGSHFPIRGDAQAILNNRLVCLSYTIQVVLINILQ